MRKVIVVGGGASGLMAAYSAAINGNSVVLLEKNEKLGKKIYITGKGRCNLSNYVDVDEFLKNVVTNPKFLFGALSTLTPKMTYDFFESNGLALKTERGNRVFPASDKASDVTKTLEKACKSAGVEVRLNAEVKEICIENSITKSVRLDDEELECNSVIVCTGGISYPLTGSTGDGYLFAQKIGHSVVEPKSSLCAIELKGSEYIPLQGVSLKNVALRCIVDGKNVFSDFGEMLFTHFGVSGPIVLSCSAMINKFDLHRASLSLDLKPALDAKTLDERLIREISQAKNKAFKNVMRTLLPAALIDVVMKRANVAGDKISANITKVERERVVSVLKNLSFDIDKLRPVQEAIVTSGGVNVKEINPKTMESKLVQGVFFAGEVLDVDAFTGGFNLQIAFSTGFVAGMNA